MAETRYIEGQERYALKEMVGRGGFATVWRAEARDVGVFGRKEEVAIKVIPVYSAAERSRALREGQIAEDLRHPNIVEPLEVIAGDTEVYLVTEFVRGMPLNEAAEEYTMEEVVDSLTQILEALEYAHERGIIHRDIKPQNALVNDRGMVKITDFGIAYRAGDTRLTRVGYAVGTPGYMAPEIMSGSDPSELTDIYAVGATAQTLLSRHPDTPPPRLREFIDRSTSPNPDHRPQSADEALVLLTGKHARPSPKPSGKSRVLPRKYSSHILRGTNGLLAAWLGYMGFDQVLPNEAITIGVAAGLGVLGYLLPRLAALAVIVALAVILLQSRAVGLGFGAVVPAIGAVWVSAGRGGVGKLPLGPLLAVPAVMVGLGAGLPLFFGALMRPVGAAFSAAAGAIALVVYEVAVGADRFIPYVGGPFGPALELPASVSPMDLSGWTEAAIQVPQLPFLVGLWAAMGGVISLGEWFGRPLAGLAVAGVGGALGYALAISTSSSSLNQAVISLGFAAIIYGLFRYLGSRARG